ncbi:MAG: AMIN domain-containing protein, partial [Elusimicrobia bacterium]|nr:AMIN domain-containing protein [Elusimicrobiota bacterium]
APPAPPPAPVVSAPPPEQPAFPAVAQLPPAPAAVDPNLPPEPKPGESIAPIGVEKPKPRRRKPAAPKASLPGMEAPAPEPKVNAVKGVPRLVKLTAKGNVVTLKLSEAAKPKVSYSPMPPRLLLDFSDAKSKLPPKDLGGSRPHITQVRARESDADSRLLWVEIQLDKTGTNRIETSGPTLKITFDFVEP